MHKQIPYKSFIILLIIVVFSCKQEGSDIHKNNYSKVKGATMGTYYGVTYSNHINYKHAIDSILVEINQSMSTYIDSAYISLINRNKRLRFDARDPLFVHFNKVYQVSQKIYEESNGYYDVTILPLVEFYGFGSEGRKSKINIDSLERVKEAVGMNNISILSTANESLVIKTNVNTQIDFSSIAKGYAVDEISNFLSTKGINNYLVDIGGEQRLSGLNPGGKPWRIGINLPEENAAYTEAILLLSLSDKSLASSGNYRNYYTVDGKKYSHTINPKTGLSEDSDLLAITVIADNCTLADGIATACMSMGFQRSATYIESKANIEACLFYLNQDSIAMHYSSNFEQYLLTHTSN